MENRRKPFKALIPLENHNKSPLYKKAMYGANYLLERTLLINKIRKIYNELPLCNDPYEFLRLALKKLNVKYTLCEKDADAIPATGPVIVVSNHPFGGVDGMILAAALSSARKDIKIMTNYFLNFITELEPLFLPVDPFQNQTAVKKNIASTRQALRWLKEGGLLMVFPAGEVSHFYFRKRRIEDPQWSPVVARLVQLSNAPVLPVYFKGRNSALFHITGIIHPHLRTAMLPRELIKKRSTEIKFRIGRPIPQKWLAAIEKPADLAEYMKFCTYQLDMSMRENKASITFPQRPTTRLKREKEIVPPRKVSLFTEEIRSLPEHQNLISGREFSVYYGRANQIPNILHEIGRLREETFRLAGEGTGNPIDLDRFDNFYSHLFVWNKDKNEVVGAYRFGPTDEILPKYGKKGLYTYTLFKFRAPFLMEISPAIEMGRTFVRKEYQKNYSPLLLLWKGIGRYVAHYPHYKHLFGAISISNDYESYSRQLIAEFLKINNYSPELAKMIKPRRRFREKRIIDLNTTLMNRRCNNIDELSSWISRVEGDGKGVPVLLKQYLKLGGKVLSFNVDNNFKEVLDGLMLVNLTRTDPKVLKRYMGEEGLKSFMDEQSGSISENRHMRKNG